MLEIIKNYITSYPNTSYSDLEEIFPKWCQGTRGVFTTLELAQNEAEQKRSRHFLKPEEIIQLTDSQIAVTTQWGIGNINHFIKQASKLDYKITLLDSNGKQISINLSNIYA